MTLMGHADLATLPGTDDDHGHWLSVTVGASPMSVAAVVQLTRNGWQRRAYPMLGRGRQRCALILDRDVELCHIDQVSGNSTKPNGMQNRIQPHQSASSIKIPFSL